MPDTLVVNEIYLSLQGESTLAGLPCVFVRLTGCNLRCSYCDSAYAFAQGQKRSLADVRAEVLRLAERFEERRGVPTGRDFSPRGVSRQVGISLRGECPDRPGLHSVGLPIANSPMGSGGEGKEGGRGENWELGVGNWQGRLPLVEVTGGEPLLQRRSLALLRALCEEGLTVLLETSGALAISPVDPRVRRIMDLKCPSSGEAGRNRWENLAQLKWTDELKFVIGTREDYEWAREQIAERQLAGVCPLLFSWVHPLAPEQQHPSLKPVPPGQTPLSRRELAERIIADALPVRLQVQLHKIIWPPEQRGV